MSALPGSIRSSRFLMHPGFAVPPQLTNAFPSAWRWVLLTRRGFDVAVDCFDDFAAAVAGVEQVETSPDAYLLAVYYERRKMTPREVQWMKCEARR